MTENYEIGEVEHMALNAETNDAENGYNIASLGFETKLCKAADKLRKDLDAAEKLAKVSFIIGSIHDRIAGSDRFYNYRHPGLRIDGILANPPFHVSDWHCDLLRD